MRRPRLRLFALHNCGAIAKTARAGARGQGIIVQAYRLRIEAYLRFSVTEANASFARKRQRLPQPPSVPGWLGTRAALLSPRDLAC